MIRWPTTAKCPTTVRPPATPQRPSHRGPATPRRPACRTPARLPATVPWPRPPPPAPWACSAPGAGSTPTRRPLRPPPAPPRAVSARAAVRPTTTPRRAPARPPSALFAPPWPHLQPDAKPSWSLARRAHRRHTDAPHTSTMSAPRDTGKRTATAAQGARNAKTPAAPLQVSLEKPRPGLAHIVLAHIVEAGQRLIGLHRRHVSVSVTRRPRPPPRRGP